MTTQFFTSQALRLTPLTPIHVGCGIDFEPTNYVIEDDVLYHFDPAQVPLSTSERKALLDAVNAGPAAALRRVQSYFHERRALYAGSARQAIAVVAGVAEQYARRIGQIAQREAHGQDVSNQLEIERSAHHPHSGALYLPGSSLKGAIRTAWLDCLNDGRARLADDRNGNALEKRLLDSQLGFHADPFRLLRVADAAGPEVLSKVYFSTNHKKRLVIKDGQELQAKGPTTRREALLGGQYAALGCELRLDLLPDQKRSDKLPGQRFNLQQLAAACNRYYLGRLRTLLEVLEQRSFAHPGWLAALRGLVDSLQPALETGDAFLLRVGRHSGAESVTLDGVREISIKQGRGMPAKFSTEGAGTLWLAAEHENTTRGGLLPFGWLLVERADAPELPALRDWCARQPKPDLAAVRTRLAEARARAAAELERAAQVEANRRAGEAAAAQAAAEQQARTAALSPNLQEVEALDTALHHRITTLRGGQDKPNTELHSRARALARRALAEGWPADERRHLADVLEQRLPRALRLDWKDERKKLQIALLRA